MSLSMLTTSRLSWGDMTKQPLSRLLCSSLPNKIDHLLPTLPIILCWLLWNIPVKKIITIQNTRTDFTPKDELEYVNYLKIIMGRHDEATTLSPALLEFAK
eukprot:TRINITY_DN73715_c0_g1_i1.p1 TRINITY_DN73715_c0_g1~~TRINITY_DN73715_c0_g1_i1.p1  ORF type:complete len:101 (+),score=2.93 TRINITY_DN73715_c0_g1_i1:90-392(+)